MIENCRVNDCQKRRLVAALEELLRFCSDATEYELMHANGYEPYRDAKTLLEELSITSGLKT